MKTELYKFSEYSSLSFDEPLNLYFGLDTSGSMDTEIPAIGKTRFETMIEQLKSLLFNINKIASVKSLPLDIGIGAMDSSEIVIRGFTSSDLPTVYAYLDSLTPDFGSTPYNIPPALARTYFLAVTHSNPVYLRKFFFLTDGEPNPLSSASQAATENADMINSTGTFATYPVNIYGIGIDLSDPTYLDLIDNTGGTEVIDTSNEGSLYNYLFSILHQPDNQWFYTSGDTSVIYDSNTYEKITIGRSKIELKSDLEKSKVDIGFSINNTFAKSWLAKDYESFLQVRIFEQNDTETKQIWSGRLVSISLKGFKIFLEFETLYTSLARYGIRRHYQRTCSHNLYGRGCNLFKGDWVESGTITAINGLTFTISTTQADNYFSHGLIQFGNVTRFIRSQVGNEFTIAKYSDEIQNEFDTNGSVSVLIYPGCDKTKQTCIYKYDNILNFGGFPYIPGKNPFKGTIL